MSQRFEKLVALLKELFQLDQPDLDFGFYRIMHAKSTEVSQFLEKELLPQVKSAFAAYQPADKAAIEKELAQAIEQAKGLGVDPESTQKVKDLRARLANEAVDLDTLEAEVYDHLYRFFRRYYSEGDFLSKRVYKEGVYAIPYEGEEVKLYWANHDQYYIKTSEYLRDYAFRLRPDDSKDPMRVHFRLVDASEGEHGNVKETTKRVFVLAADDFIETQDGPEGPELVLRFEYRPATESDWPDDERGRKAKPPVQKEFNAVATDRVLAVTGTAFARWIEALGKPHVKSDGTKSEHSRLRAHVERYTARNTFDYFIHKDLGGFLRRELDFFIKNEVMHLDDIESESTPRVEQYLSKIKVIRKIAGKIIDFLAQLENFQKKLWLKKKFVTETRWCVLVGRVLQMPGDLRDRLLKQVAGNAEQRREWIASYDIDQVEATLSHPGYTEPLSAAFLEAHPHLVIDTGHFGDEFGAELVSAIDDIENETNGVLIEGDNFDGLALVKARHAETTRCVYIDPPFNTDSGDFLYKDSYQHASWISMMDSRLPLARSLLADDGTLYVHIDYNEKERLKLLLDQHFEYFTEIIWRIGWISGYKSAANKFIRNHDTIYQYAKTSSPLFMKSYIAYPDGYTRRDGSPPTGQGYPLEDTWNCSDLDQLHSIQIISFSREKVGNRALTQKNENLVARMVRSSSASGDLVLDYFLGSGTTAAVAHKLGRRWIGIESGPWLSEYALPRMKRVLSGDKHGISAEVGWTGGGIFKILHLESYEDTLNNLHIERSNAQTSLLDAAEAAGADGLREQYMLRYMLDVETRGSASLLNIDAFMDPTAYRLKVKRPGSDESREVCVDLLETFDWLLGLVVRHIAAPRYFEAKFMRDPDPDLPKDAPRRLHLDGRLEERKGGRWWFRTVEGELRDGRKTLVIWRNRPGGEEPEGVEQDNLVLDAWFEKQGYSSKDSEFDLIYVNGTNNLENLKAPDDTWKVRLIEEDFHRLMFETAES